MADVKITEAATGSNPSADTYLLVVQAETVDGTQTQALRRLGVSTMRGSNGVFESRETLNNIEDVLVTLRPKTYVLGSLWSAATNAAYGSDRTDFAYAVYDVAPGKQYHVSGRSGPLGTAYPLITYYDAHGNRISTVGTDNYTVYTETVTAPSSAVTMAVNSSNAQQYPIAVTASITLLERIKNLDPESYIKLAEVKKEVDRGYFAPCMDGLINEAKKNPFQWKAFDRGYVSFVFDDLRSDIDSPRSIFEQKGYPICLAAIPSRKTAIASGLSADRGSYTVGMTMEDICLTAVSLGGEVLAHNANWVTESTQYDKDFMYDYFVATKKQLESWGLTIRGLIRSGGEGQIDTSPEVERWLVGNYEYSNFGYTQNHAIDRISINQSMETIKAAIDAAVTNKNWIRFMCHDYSYGGGNTFTGESDLVEILDYCASKGIEVVTYAYMYDHFGGNKLETSASMSRTEIDPTSYVAESYLSTNSVAYTGAATGAHAVYAVQAGKTYYVTGRSPYRGDTYPVCIFFNDSSTYRIQALGTGTYEEWHDIEVAAPVGATKMVVNCSDTINMAIKVKVDADVSEKLELLESAIDSANDDVDALEDRVHYLEKTQEVTLIKITPTSSVSGQIMSAIDKTAYPDGGGRAGFAYSVFDVEAGDTYYVTGRAAHSGAVYPAVAFFNDNSNYRLSAHGVQAEQELDNYEVVAPTGATHMIINSTNTNTATITAKGELDTGEQMLDIQRRLAILEAAITPS